MNEKKFYIVIVVVVLRYIVADTYAWHFVFIQQVKQNLRLSILMQVHIVTGE